MNKKNIKGITVEINGNVTPLNKALEKVNKTSKGLQKELRGINTLLGFNPDNTELVKQKQVVLKEAVAESEKKLKTLITTQKQMNKAGSDLNSEAYRDLQREIASTQNELTRLKAQQTTFAKLSTAAKKLATGGMKLLAKTVGVATKTFTKTGNAVTKLRQKMPKLDTALTKVGSKAGQVASGGLGKARKALEKTGAGITKLRQKMPRLDAALTKVGTTTKKVSSGGLKIAKTAFGKVGTAVTKLRQKLPKLDNALTKVGTAAKKISAGGLKVLTKTVGGATKAFGGFVAGVGALAVAAVGSSVKAAMSLEATQAKYNTVFQGYTKQMDETIEKFQKLTPATKAAAKSMSSGIQDLLIPMGLARDKATDMTSETMNLVGALTNFNSETHTAEDVQTAFLSALTGMYRPLKSLGIQTSVAEVKQRAFEMGLADSTKSADKAAQAQALLAIATEQSGDALAAYNEESLDAKTRMGLLKSDITDMAAGLGTALLPAINDTLAVVRDASNEVMPEFNTLFQSIAGLFSDADGSVEAFSDSFSSLFEVIMGKATDFIPTLVDVVTTLLPALMPAFWTVVNGLVDLLPTVLPQLISTAIILFSGLMEGLDQTIPKIMDMLPGLIETIGNVIKANAPSIIKSGVNILVSLVTGIANAIPTLIKQVTELIPVMIEAITSNLPTLINAGLTALTAIVTGLVQGIPTLIAMLPQIISTIATVLTSNLPTILETGVMLLNEIINGIVNSLPVLIDMLPQIIEIMQNVLMENLPLIIQTGIELLNAVINGIISALPLLIAALPKIISSIVNFIIANLPMIISSGIQLIGALIAGLIQAIPALIAALPEIIIAIFDTFANINWEDIGGNIIAGIADGVKNAAKNLVSSVVDAAKAAVNGVKEFLDIRSPSRVMRDQVGAMMAEGVGVGYVDEMDAQTKKMQNATPTTFDSYFTQQNRKSREREVIRAGGYTQTINNYSPKALSPSETARKTRNATRQMILKLKGV